MANKYIKSLAKRIVENSRYDKQSDTLFVTNPGISPEVLKSIAIKNNFKIGQTASGEYISIPRGVSGDFFKDKILSQFDNFMDSYTLYDKNYSSLLTSYKVYDLMCENLGEVQLIIDSYVDEILSTSFVDSPLIIKIDDNKAQDFVMDVLENNKFFTKLPMLIRMLVKYGNAGLCLSYPFLENKDGELHPSTFNIENDNDSNNLEIDVVKQLNIRTINPKYFKVVVDGYLNPINYETTLENTYQYNNQVVNANSRVWQPWQFVHWLLPDDDTAPYGKSILYSMRSSFDQLTTLEALLAVSRASKIQRLVISIPMPKDIGITDAYLYMNEFIANYNNSIFTQAPGTKAGKKVPAATEVLYKPALEGFSIDTIESKIDLSSTEDVEYFLDKILRNSKLPKGYLVGDDIMTTGQTLEAQDLKFSRALQPIRTAIIDGTIRLVECILAHGGYDVSKRKITVEIERPIQVSTDTIDKYTSIIELLKSITDINQIPTVNQYQFLVELGIPDKLAQLICSRSTIGIIKNKNSLQSFLKNQIVTVSDTKTNNSSKSVEESVKESVANTVATEVVASGTSDKFRRQNIEFMAQLKELSSYTKTDDGKRSLKESLLISTKKTLND